LLKHIQGQLELYVEKKLNLLWRYWLKHVHHKMRLHFKLWFKFLTTVVKIDFIENRQWRSRKVDKSTIWGLSNRFFKVDCPWINNLKWSVNSMMQQRFLFKKPIIGFIFLWML
jgi:hypothetical protein